MPVDTVALRGTNWSAAVGIEDAIRGVAGTILTDGRFSREPRIDPAEIIALPPERRGLPKNLAQTIDSLREEIGEFIVSNLNTPQTGFGFNTKPADPLEMGPIQEMVWRTRSKISHLSGEFPNDLSVLRCGMEVMGLSGLMARCYRAS